jgi:hypothetical protein
VTPAGDEAGLVRDYLHLGLRLGRHIRGYVDCWFGDPALAERVDAEPLIAPAELLRDAARLRQRLDDAVPEGDRRRFLAAQLTAMECTAGLLAGHRLSLQEELRRCYGVEAAPGDADGYAAAHREIGRLVGGNGPLPDRVEAFYERNTVPPEHLLGCVEAVSEALRPIVRPMFGLPVRERVEYQVVHDEPWNAFNRYLGGYRSQVRLNATAGRNIAALPILVTHEAYAGHHTEHCLKEAGLVGAGLAEHAIALAATPASLMAEGAAELSLDVVLGAGWGAWTAPLLAQQGVRVEGEAVERLLMLLRRLWPVRQDAMLMLHDQGADPAEVIEYVQRWLLLPPERAGQVVAFLQDPLWRTYTVTYVQGARLVGDWLGQASSDSAKVARFARLLRDPLLPADIAPRASVAAS